MHVCGIISELKSTWEEVANSGKFNKTLENVLNEQRENLTQLQHEVSEFLQPYEKAADFLSWTVTQMASIQNDTHLAEYPSNGFDDIVLAEYLTNGTAIIMNFDVWISRPDLVNLSLERTRIIGPR